MDPMRMAQLHRERGKRLYYEEGQVAQAVQELQTAYGFDPRDAETLHLLAEIYGAAGFIDPAVNFIQRSLQENYMNVDGWVLYVNLLAQKGGGYLDVAMQQLDLASGLNPDHPMLLYLRGNILAQKGEIDKAREALRRSLELDPDNPFARHDLEAIQG